MIKLKKKISEISQNVEIKEIIENFKLGGGATRQGGRVQWDYAGWFYVPSPPASCGQDPAHQLPTQ